MNPNRLMIIDDEPDIGELIKDVAEGIGFEVSVSIDATDFQETLSAFSPDVIVLDLQMPHVDGVEMLRLLAGQQCSAQILLISGTDTKILTTARRLGVTHGLNMLESMQKPLNVAELEATLAGTK